TACNRSPHNGMQCLIERRPTPGIDGTKDGHTWRTHGIGNMGRSGIIADKEVQFTNYGSQSAKRSLANYIKRLCLHTFNYGSYCCLFIRTACQDDLCIETLSKVVSDSGKVFDRPAAHRRFRTRMQP